MIRLFTDSVASIPAALAEKLNIRVMSLFIHEGDVEHVETEMDLDDFYRRLPGMTENLPTSSQPSQHAFEQAFEEAAQAGDDVIGIFISTFMSGTVDGAVRAARAVKSRNLNFRAAIIDSASTGFDEGFVPIQTAKAIAEGLSFEECVQRAKDTVVRTRFLFAPENLTFLQKGGRIGNAKALLGNLIKVTPVITVVDGVPTDIAKVRTQKKAIAAIFDRFKADVESKGLVDAVVHYIGTPDVAIKWAHEVVEPFLGRSVEVLPVSPVVGLHVGPAVGIAYTCIDALEGKLTNPDLELVTYV